MEETEPDRKRSTVAKSPINRKPLLNLTNIVRKPYHTSLLSQSKELGPSTASDSSIGSTQNPNHVPDDQSLPSTHPRPAPAYAQRKMTQKARSNTKADAPFYQTWGNGSIKDQGKGNPSSLNKMKYDVKEISMGFLSPSMKKNVDKRKAIDVPFSSHHTRSAKSNIETPIPHSTLEINDKGKANFAQYSYTFTGNTKHNKGKDVPKYQTSVKETRSSRKEGSVPLCSSTLEKTKKVGGETVAGSSHAGIFQKDKGKAVATPINYHSLEMSNAMLLNCPSMRKVKNNMAEVFGPLSGVNIKEKGETVSGSSHFDLPQKDKGKAVATPINYRTPEKKDKGMSCPPLLRNTRNRNEADGARHISQIKLQTEPPNKKKKCSSSNKDCKNYSLPQDFVEQQRAYFKEIDDFELEVEEV